MFTNIQQIQEELVDTYTYLVVPTAMLDTPVETTKMILEDGTYGTINQLSAAMGSAFTPVGAMDGFSKFRWAVEMDGENEANLITFMEEGGLVNMRTKGVPAKDIDYTALKGNEFGLFNMYEVKCLPEPTEDVLD